jgi:hypothetical protein
MRRGLESFAERIMPQCATIVDDIRISPHGRRCGRLRSSPLAALRSDSHPSPLLRSTSTSIANPKKNELDLKGRARLYLFYSADSGIGAIRLHFLMQRCNYFLKCPIIQGEIFIKSKNKVFTPTKEFLFALRLIFGLMVLYHRDV